jgi:hypothetical protein
MSWRPMVTGFVERQELTAALQEDQHLPLLRMLVRPNVALRLQNDHQSLNLVMMALMQQQMRALARADFRFPGEIRDR